MAEIIVIINFGRLGRQGMLSYIPGWSFSIHHRFDCHKTRRPLGRWQNACRGWRRRSALYKNSSISLLALLISLHLYLWGPDVLFRRIVFNGSMVLNLPVVSRTDWIRGMLATIRKYSSFYLKHDVSQTILPPSSGGTYSFGHNI
jgi:hypothetical protein